MFCHGGPWYSLFFSRGLAQARRPEELAESQRPETGRVRGERVTIVLFFYSELCYATNRDPRAAESPKDAHESPKKKKNIHQLWLSVVVSQMAAYHACMLMRVCVLPGARSRPSPIQIQLLWGGGGVWKQAFLRSEHICN